MMYKCYSCGKSFNHLLKTSYYTTERDIRSQGQDYGTYSQEHILHVCPSCGSQNTNYSKIQEAEAKRKERAEENRKISAENAKALHANLGRTLTLYGLVDYLNRNIQDFSSIKFTVNGKEMTSADIAAIFKKGAVVNLTCDPKALQESETAYYNKFTKEELIRKMFGRKAVETYSGKISMHLQNAYARMLKNSKDKILYAFKKWQAQEINTDEAYNMLFLA